MRSEQSGLRRRVPIGLVGLMVAAAATVGVCAPASASDLRYACPATVADCTVVTGDRIDLPAGHGIDEIVKRDQVTCPSGVPVGYSYQTGNVGQTQVFVQVWQSYPNTDDIWNPAGPAPASCSSGSSTPESRRRSRTRSAAPRSRR